MFKVKKPHDRYIQDLMDAPSVMIKNDRAAGLYYSKMSKRVDARDIFGLHPVKQDSWIMYRKNPFSLNGENRKYSQFRRR